MRFLCPLCRELNFINIEKIEYVNNCECCVCCENNLNVVFPECYHKCTCMQCVLKLRIPYDITDMVEMYLKSPCELLYEIKHFGNSYEKTLLCTIISDIAKIEYELKMTEKAQNKRNKIKKIFRKIKGFLKL